MSSIALWVAAALAVRGVTGWLFADVLMRAAAGGIASDGHFLYAPAAAALLAGEGYVVGGSPVSSHMPGYPLILALALAVTPSIDTAVLVVQTLGGALVVGGIFALGRLLLGERAGQMGAAVALVFPDLVAYSLLNLAETPQLLCVIAATLCTVKVLRGEGAWTAAALGLTLGVGTLIRESTVLFAGVWYVALLAVAWAPPRVRAARVMLAATVFVIVLAPWWVRNANTFGQFVPLSSKGMRNVYLGTIVRPYPVSDYRNRVVVVDERELERDREVNRRAGGAATFAGRDRVFLAAALENVRRDPVGQLQHLGRKFLFLWTPNIAPRHAGRIGIPVALWGAAGFYLAVLGAGVVGLWRCRRDRVVVVALVAPLVVNTLFHMLVGIAEPRYHFQVLPALLIGTGLVLAQARDFRHSSGPGLSRPQHHPHVNPQQIKEIDPVSGGHH